jgi:hypothetical protein
MKSIRERAKEILEHHKFYTQSEEHIKAHEEREIEYIADILKEQEEQPNTPSEPYDPIKSDKEIEEFINSLV